MDKKEQLLIIEPQNELKFSGPFNVPVTTYMRLSNPTDDTILFKVKTTAPRKYCVRPNFGAVLPKSTVEVTICLQTFAFDPNEKNKHKFMVQSFVVPDDSTDYDKLWKEVEPEQLMDSKLRCVFDVPVKSASESDTNESIPQETSTKLVEDKSTSQDGQTNDFDIKTHSEILQLRENDNRLRSENLQLKEQLVRLRMTIDANQKEQSMKKSMAAPLQSPYTPPQPGQQIPLIYIGMAVLMAIIGFWIGKFL